MDQSLRTVATQLLNVTNPNDSKESSDNPKIINNEKTATNHLLYEKNNNNVNEKLSLNPVRLSINDNNNDMKLVAEINSGIGSLATMGVGFGRPTNSKFGYFESSHPGQAMAMTEEELERELAASSSTRLITAHKNNPTTTGGISTWILLNPPTTTTRNVPIIIDQKPNDDKVLNPKIPTDDKLTKTVEIAQTTAKTDVKTVTKLEKIVSSQLTTPMQRITTLTRSTTPSLKKTNSNPAITTESTPKFTETTMKLEKKRITSNPKISSIITTEPSVLTVEPSDSITIPKIIVTTQKNYDTNRSTLRPKITTPKSTDVTSKPMSTKLSRPSNVSATKSKQPSVRKPTTRLPVETTKNPSTSKIEKVTIKPVYTLTTPKTIENRVSLERPAIFMSKIKTSIATDSKTEQDIQMSSVNPEKLENVTKSQQLDIERPIVSTKTNKPTRPNNVLKVKLKKPTESPATIEHEIVQINEPILRVEKIPSNENSPLKKNSTKIVNSGIIDDSPIDVKFVFNPIVTSNESENLTTPIDSVISTTKRPHKRKRNKLRRRKPAKTIQTTTIAPSSLAQIVTIPSSVSTSTESLDILTELGIADNTIQESKIEPESKVATAVNGDVPTKNKKKQVQKPIATQLYNYLSREVMPSFGVMSLLGLGFGLASYFFYPFGGAIARRNYIVEPDYKYRNDEYGGNYGENEEEVFSKVLQGMTRKDGKYGGIKDYENNFYRYQQTNDASPAYIDVKQTTGRLPSDLTRYSTDSSSAIYRPVETTRYSNNNNNNNEKYRNTEFRYPEFLSTTPNYYDRSRKPDFVGKKAIDGQFVVGNVPKEYGYVDETSNLDVTTSVTTEQTILQQQNDNYNVPIDISTSYGHAEALKASNDDYDEIGPSAVQVEHGPRSMKHLTIGEKSGKLRRRKRDSVIQMIPSRTEIAREIEEIEKEEPLSNEILEIIDSVIPIVSKVENKKDDYEKHTVEKKASGDDSKTKLTFPIATKDTIDRMTNETEELMDKSGITEETLTSVVPEKITEKLEILSETTLANEEITEKLDDTEKTTKYPDVMEATSSDSSVTTSTTTIKSLTIDEIIGATSSNDDKNPEDSSIEWFDNTTTLKPQPVQFNFFTYVKKIAEAKLRLGVAIMKHASEGFARYLGHVQKRINGEE